MNSGQEEKKDITADDLKNIMNKDNPSQPIAYGDRKGKRIQTMWLFFDNYTGSFVLVRRSYPSEDKAQINPNFNHVTLDGIILLDDFADKVPEIILEAKEKIKDGKCYIWRPDNDNNTFAEEKQCNKPHNYKNFSPA